MTISSSEIKRNMTIMLEGEVFQILEWQHRQAPKAPPTLTLKLRQLSSGNVYERKLDGNKKLTVAPTEDRSCQYLYRGGSSSFVFMDNESFEQYEIGADKLGDSMLYISEGSSVQIKFYNEEPIYIDVPPSVELTIAESDAGVKGDTAGGAVKPAVTDTGLTIQVPLFIKVGDKVMINTQRGEYIGRS